MSSLIKATDQIIQALDETGDGTGNINQNVNGSITPVKFMIKPPVTEKNILKRLNLHAIDLNWNDAKVYGAIGVLPNGIRIYIENDSGIIKEYTNNFKIKRTHDWALLAGIDTVSIGSAGADPFTVRWTFERSFSDIVIDGAHGERFVMEIPDDLTGLDDQIAVIQGHRVVY